MNNINLSGDLLNSQKIMFHIGKMLEDISRGRNNFNPISIEVHPTAVCNHRCIHCSYMERNECRESITEEVMQKLIDSIIHMGIRAVYFSGGGEPTLYPHLGEYIEKLYQNGVESSIITNGSCFEKMGLVKIADKLNYIAVSVPAVDIETFETITGTRNMEEVLQLPKKIKQEYGSKSPIIGSRIVLTNKNYKQVDHFLQEIKDRGFDYALFKIVRDYEDNGQGLSNDEEMFLKNEIKKYKDIDESFTNIKKIFGYRENPEFINNCWVNYFGMIANISTNGKVYPNIVEIDKEEFCIGDLNKDILENIWNSERHNEVKKISNEKWKSGMCKNCRAMPYNKITNELMQKLPNRFDPFI